MIKVWSQSWEMRHIKLLTRLLSGSSDKLKH